MRRSAVGSPSSDPRSPATCGGGRRAGDVWHLDEVVVKCAAEKFWLWRAVDRHGAVLEEILQKRRGRRAAKRLLVALMKRCGLFPNGSSLISSTPTARQRRTWLPALTIGRTRASIIGPRTAICRFENENEPYRVTDRREHYSGSSPCIPLPAIAFLFLPAAAPHKQFATIASKHSRHGKLRHASPKIRERQPNLGLRNLM